MHTETIKMVTNSKHIAFVVFPKPQTPLDCQQPTLHAIPEQQQQQH